MKLLTTSALRILTLALPLLFTAPAFAQSLLEQTSHSSVTALQKHFKISNRLQDFRYGTSPKNSNFRDLYRIECELNSEPKSPAALIRKYAFNPEQSLRSSPYEVLPGTVACDSRLRAKLSTGLAPNSFDQMDFQAISNLNTTFYGEAFEAATMSFQHGHKTDKVYVFLPGFSEDYRAFFSTGARMFQRGNNVIVGTLPGFANSSWDISQVQAGHWILYADYIIRMAHSYGDKVIVVGNSSGANLGSRIAEDSEGLVDGLFLIQPFFGFSTMAKVVIELGPQVPQALLAFIGRQLDLAEMGDTRPIFAQMDRLLHISFLPGKKYRIPIVAVIAENDEAVSSKETLRWLELKAPGTPVLRHRQGHLHRPTDSDPETWNRLIQL